MRKLIKNKELLKKYIVQHNIQRDKGLARNENSSIIIPQS